MNLPDEKREALVRFLHNEGDGGIWESFDRANAETVADALAPLLAGWLADARAVGKAETVRPVLDVAEEAERRGYQRGLAEGEARVRARVEALADEWESRAANARSCAEARLGLSDAEGLRAHADLMQRRADDLRVALDADAAETTGGGA